MLNVFSNKILLFLWHDDLGGGCIFFSNSVKSVNLVLNH